MSVSMPLQRHTQISRENDSIEMETVGDMKFFDALPDAREVCNLVSDTNTFLNNYISYTAEGCTT